MWTQYFRSHWRIFSRERRPDKGGGNGGGGSNRVGGGRKSSGTALKTKKVGAPGGGARVQVRYDAHLPVLSIQDGENTHTARPHYFQYLAPVWGVLGVLQF